jgi:hypothetical protein
MNRSCSQSQGWFWRTSIFATRLAKWAAGGFRQPHFKTAINAMPPYCVQAPDRGCDPDRFDGQFSSVSRGRGSLIAGFKMSQTCAVVLDS